MTNRKLALKREVLVELADADLRGIAAGDGGSETCASCMTWVSCYMTDCLTRMSLADCIAIDDPGITRAGC